MTKSTGEVGKVLAREVPVVVKERVFDNLHVRFLADRLAGVVVWESYFLDNDGKTVGEEFRRFRSVELHHLDVLINLLQESKLALTPRRRLDLASLDPPSSVAEEQKG